MHDKYCTLCKLRMVPQDVEAQKPHRDEEGLSARRTRTSVGPQCKILHFMSKICDFAKTQRCSTLHSPEEEFSRPSLARLVFRTREAMERRRTLPVQNSRGPIVLALISSRASVLAAGSRRSRPPRNPGPPAPSMRKQSHPRELNCICRACPGGNHTLGLDGPSR